MFFDENLISNKVYGKLDRLVLKNEAIAIGVSGGVDSLFLASIISSYYKINYDISNVFCIIINHNLRENSKHDAFFAKSVLKKLGFENIHIENWEHEEITSGIEEKARIARYSIIKEFCKKNGIEKVLLGHHLDDQIETFFMNAFRRSGTIGLGGMLEKNEKNGITFVRPLLEIQKKQIIKFMQDNKIPWVEDETNLDEDFTRNKIRAMLSKAITKDDEYLKLFGTISAVQEVNEMIKNEIKDFLQTQETNEDGITLNLRQFQNLPRPKQIYLIYEIFQTLNTSSKPRFDQIQDFIFITSGTITSPRKLYFCETEITLSPEKISFKSNS